MKSGVSGDMKARMSLVLNCFFELGRNCCWETEHVICIYSDALPLLGAFQYGIFLSQLTVVMHSMQNKSQARLTEFCRIVSLVSMSLLEIARF